MRFENRTAFVTGAGGYIGGTTAQRFALEGANVAVCDINDEMVQRTVETIRAAGGRAIGVKADVTNSASVNAAIAKTVEVFGGVDIMVHAAGGSARGKMAPLIEQTDDVLESVLQINLFGALYASRAAAREMVRQGRGGRIINISSVVALNGLRGCVDYAASKGGIIAMTRSLCKELAEYGITVNTVAPGIVQRPGEKNDAVHTNFLGVRCTAEDVANVILFLASEEARFVTGQTYAVDGGRGLAMKGSD